MKMTKTPSFCLSFNCISPLKTNPKLWYLLRGGRFVLCVQSACVLNAIFIILNIINNTKDTFSTLNNKCESVNFHYNAKPTWRTFLTQPHPIPITVTLCYFCCFSTWHHKYFGNNIHYSAPGALATEEINNTHTHTHSRTTVVAADRVSVNINSPKCVYSIIYFIIAAAAPSNPFLTRY